LESAIIHRDAIRADEAGQAVNRIDALFGGIFKTLSTMPSMTTPKNKLRTAIGAVQHLEAGPSTDKGYRLPARCVGIVAGIALLASGLPACADDMIGQASIIDGDTLEIHGNHVRGPMARSINRRSVKSRLLPLLSLSNIGRTSSNSFLLPGLPGTSPLFPMMIDHYLLLLQLGIVM